MTPPEWTDHDVSDPGITLAQLFPFLGEQLDFRNPERRRRLLVVAFVAVAVLFWWRGRGDD